MTAVELNVVLGRLYDVQSYAFGAQIHGPQSRIEYIHEESIHYINDGATFDVAIEDVRNSIQYITSRHPLRPVATPWKRPNALLPPTTPHTLN